MFRSVISLRHYSTFSLVKQVGIVGVPFDKGQHINSNSINLGPKAIRDGGLLQEIISFNVHANIKDYGDIKRGKLSALESPKNMTNYHEVVNTMHNLSDKVLEVLKDGRMCITLGGDHSLGFGSIDGHLRYNKDIVVFWIDAHADLNTNSTSYTGNIHGMSVALLAKELRHLWPKDLPGLEWLQPNISLKNFVYIGLRSVDPLEKLILHKYNMHAFGMEDIDRHGIVKVMEKALDAVDPGRVKGIHCSFDIDALDALEVPSTGTPVRGGLALREGAYIMEELQRTGRLEAVDLVEVNPNFGNLEDLKKTVDAAIQIIKASCGHERSGNLPLDIQDIPCKY